MASFAFHDGNITNLIDNRFIDFRHDANNSLQMHSALIQRLRLERELEGHLSCVNTIAWNSKGSLLISGSDDTQINIWNYPTRNLSHSIDTGHSANIFCTKFIPETSDELVASGAGDGEVRMFNLSQLRRDRAEETAMSPFAHFQCHTRRVKKLAVEVGNPNVVWSASEDGTVRQHDLREGCSCPPGGSSRQECRNVLLDLRCAAKRSLADPPKQLLALKTCDISTTRPHLLLVGGSDAFARLYDRRMLPPLSSSQTKLSPPPCVNYFSPMHLSERGQSILQLTHVTFSPNGAEILISYSGEHVYLFDVNQESSSVSQYSSGDAAKRFSFSHVLNGKHLQTRGASTSERPPFVKSETALKLDKCRKLLQFAEKILKGGDDYYHGIEACNEILDGHVHDVDTLLKHDCLCTRASLLLKRMWKNDAHMAVRDLNEARRIDCSSFNALFLMAEALMQLGKHKEALDFALAAHSLVPSSAKAIERVESIRRHLVSAESKESNKTSDGSSKAEPRAGRVISLSDILYRSTVSNDDAARESSRSEREDSDYEELELDFGASGSGDEEEHDADSNVPRGSLNLRIRRRRESARDAGGSNGSCSSPSSSQYDKTAYQPEAAIDMKRRFIGHCNMGTDIKQASFLGQKGEYVASGSDDGRWFIWEKRTGRLIKMLLGDEAVVNCVQCHPFDSVVATSGIDSTIKIWTPFGPRGMTTGGSAGPDIGDELEAMEGNQHRLRRSSSEAMLPYELLEQFRVHDFTGSAVHPFECTQS